MPLYRPKELLDWLTVIGAAPKKGLSQNFLIDGNVIRKIVASGAVAPGDRVLEIGPGPGALTEELLKTGAEVIAIERDELFAAQLRRLDTVGTQLKVYCEDVLECNLEQICREGAHSENQPLKILANLPYHITTPILIQLLEAQLPLTHLVFMVQEEVARRMTAAPGSKIYGSLSVFLRFYTTPVYVGLVGRRCFYPVPKVDSAIVLLKPHAALPAVNPEQFFALTRQAFGQRRKMVRSALSELCPSAQVAQALEAIGCNPAARAEELSLEQFLALYRQLK